MRKLLTCLALLAGVASASADYQVGSPEWLRERRLEALIVSRIAAKVCPGMAFNRGLAAITIEEYDIRSEDDLPQEILERTKRGFSERREQACNYAWEWYRRGGRGAPNIQFLFNPPTPSPFRD